MSEDKTKDWSKALKEELDSLCSYFDYENPSEQRSVIIDIVNFAIQEEQEKAPNCEDCDERRDDEPQHNEGYD